MVDINFDTKVRRHAEVTAVVRRRRWTVQEKGRMVAEAMAPGAVIADVARRYDLAPQHLSNWIRAAKAGRIVLPGEPDFVPVIAAESSRRTSLHDRVVPVEIAAGPFVVRVAKGVEAGALEAVLRSLRRVVE